MYRRGGIDSQIEQRKMQFGKNPQALQQRYGQSKQLLDLLALQQIAEEQKQKSQMMQMQMQQNPTTIAEQVEQEALQGKKAEMAQSLQGMQAMRAPKRSQSETARGVAGALAQMQREQQSRMQRMASSGVAGQRARNMERMYNGGIVGFDNGGAVTQADIEGERRRNPRLRGASDDEIRKILERRASMLDFDAEGIQERAAQDPRARGYLTPEEPKEVKPLSERGVTLEPEETRMALPGGDLPEGLMPASMQRQIEGRKSLDATLENPEFQAFLEEAAGGFEPTPAPRPKIGDERQALLDGLTGSSPEAVTPSAPVASTDPSLAAETTPTSPTIPTASETTAPRTIQDRISGILGTLEARYKKEEEDIKQAEEDIEARYGGRSVGKKFLDRLKRAAQLQAAGPMRTTDRSAVAGLLGGFAKAEAEEEAKEKAERAKLTERGQKFSESQLGAATGLAAIDLGRAKLAQQGEQFGELMRQKDDQFTRTLNQRVAEAAQKNEQFDATMILEGRKLTARILRDVDQAQYQQESLRIQGRANELRQEAAVASTDIQRKRIASELRKNNTAQGAALRKEKAETLKNLEYDSEYLNADDAKRAEMRKKISSFYDLQIQAYSDDTNQFIKDLTGMTVPDTAPRVEGGSSGTDLVDTARTLAAES